MCCGVFRMCGGSVRKCFRCFLGVFPDLAGGFFFDAAAECTLPCPERARCTPILLSLKNRYWNRVFIITIFSMKPELKYPKMEANSLARMPKMWLGDELANLTGSNDLVSRCSNCCSDGIVNIFNFNTTVGNAGAFSPEGETVAEEDASPRRHRVSTTSSTAGHDCSR